MRRKEIKVRKMKTNKQLHLAFCALLVALLLCAFLPNAHAAESDPLTKIRQTASLSIIAEGQFAGAGGAQWTLYDDGVLVVESGTINRNVTVSLWAAWADDIVHIEFRGPITAGPNLHSLFRGLVRLETIIGLEHFDVSGVTGNNGMHAMFQDTHALRYISDLSEWDTSNVRDTRNMFMRTALETIDGISAWDVSNVLDMRTMFQHAPNLTSLDLSSWNPTNVQAMQFMFANTPALTSVGDLSNWDTGSATTMQAMFQDTPALKSVGDLSSWDTSSVTTMNGMFAHTGLTTIAVHHWDVSNVLNMQSMFQQSPNLTALDLSNWNPTSVTTMHQMFMNTPALTSVGDLSNWDTGSVTTMQSMFQDTAALKNIPGISHWNTERVTNMTNMFLRAGVTSLDLSSWDTSNVSAMGFMFADNALTSLDVSTWDTANATAMNTMFRNSALSRLDLSSWNTSRANMANIFQGMAALRVLILGEYWIVAAGNPNLPAITADTVYTGRWQNVAGGTETRPMGEIFYTSSQLMTGTNGTSNTWIWETWEAVESPALPQRYAYLIGHNGLIRPNDNITRAEVATIFFRVITEDMRKENWSQTNPYSDVLLDNWFNTAVSTTTQLGMFYGMPDGTFAPNQPITRAELTAVIARFMDIMDVENIENDFFYDIAGHWANGYINAAANKHWLRGPEGMGGAFYPDQAITRAETAAMVNQIFERLPETTADLLPDMVTWPDSIDSDAWYYLYMQAASNSYTFTKRDSFEHWVEILPVPDWALIEQGSAP